MPLKNICITMRVTNAEGYDEPRDSISHDWLNRLASWDMAIHPVPNIGAEAVDYARELAPALLILSGGEDIGVSPIRDETETALLNFALATKLPVFGVCRGLQFLNYHFSGSLGTVDGHVATSHDVALDDAWVGYYGPSVTVNSYHNVAIPADGLATPLQATATDSVGNVEAARHRDLPVAGVMWHPERQGAPEGDRLLINALIDGSA